MKLTVWLLFYNGEFNGVEFSYDAATRWVRSRGDERYARFECRDVTRYEFENLVEEDYTDEEFAAIGAKVEHE